ncbi:MAG: Cyclic nucleotide-binding domain, partial [Armatimonadetes bacterium]|nr:Cyclic nucleotide-binding domain [Armatimonadota bacterium]
MSQREPALLDLDSWPLADIVPKVRFWKGGRIGTQGEPCDTIYIIAEGQVLLSRRNPDGDDYALYLLGAGDLLGEGACGRNKRWLVSVRALTDGSAYALPASQLPRFAQHYP